ncbi:hypothetical protein EXS65_02010 [Candidatus Peribacteria bacterium]|nr:hypothetical protein [Candidatus Peribacteria bacterium]
MQLSLNDILSLLSVIAVLMLIVLIYHMIFVSVSLRRIADRMDDLSKEIEGLVLKPIGAIEYLIDWFAGAVEGMRAGKEVDEKKAHKHKN